MVRAGHDECLDGGVDAIETSTFGANLGNLGEYDITKRIEELPETVPAWAGRRPRPSPCATTRVGRSGR